MIYNVAYTINTSTVQESESKKEELETHVYDYAVNHHDSEKAPANNEYIYVENKF